MDRATRRVMFAQMFVELHLIELKSCIKWMTFKVIQGHRAISSDLGNRPMVTLQLHNFDLFRTCRTSSFCTVAWQLARFELTRRITRSLGNSWASCWDIASYLSKVTDFNPPHLHLAPQQGFTPVEFRGDFWRQKTRVPGYPVVLFVWS